MNLGRKKTKISNMLLKTASNTKLGDMTNTQKVLQYIIQNLVGNFEIPEHEVL